jgi:hypothetical protein
MRHGKKGRGGEENARKRTDEAAGWVWSGGCCAGGLEIPLRRCGGVVDA